MADDTETTTTAPTATATATPANDPATPKKDSKTSSVHSTPLSKSGWDGKLRIEKKAVLVNSEILSDPDYSDEDAPPVDRIDADEASLPNLHLERFTKLEKLGLRNNHIPSIELPEVLSETLVELEISDNMISHCKGFETCTKLKSLDLGYNNIKHIKRVGTLKALEHLYLVQNKISRIEGLDGLTNLKNLELGANRIRVIEGLETLTALEQLWLGQNKISKLENLDTLTNLKTLSIQANRITSLSSLARLPHLEELYISDNLITTLEPLSANTALHTLDVQNNPLASLTGTKPLARLENFWASNCKLESFRELERELGDKRELKEVYFEGNPLQKQNEVLYRNKVRLALPQVVKIDAAYVRVG
ncbi:hypothetical protein LTR28_006970 [Elasticomyces elasticus]|nr:hypothetical protein LTR28_006970 [Elasticomyces elasticus]